MPSGMDYLNKIPFIFSFLVNCIQYIDTLYMYQAYNSMDSYLALFANSFAYPVSRHILCTIVMAAASVCDVITVRH